MQVYEKPSTQEYNRDAGSLIALSVLGACELQQPRKARCRASRIRTDASCLSFLVILRF